MSITTLRVFAVASVILGTCTVARAQPLPTTQPNLLEIVIEDVKHGRAAEHAKHEAGWPAAYEKSKSTAYYLALVSMSGPPQAWYIAPWESHAAIGENMKRDDGDPALTAELSRLSRLDAEMLNGSRTVLVSARKDLSYGAYPDLARQRYFEFTWFRVRPGHEAGFEAAARAYGAAAKRTGNSGAFRVYQIVAGGNSPTYLVTSSVASYADFDRTMADGEKTMKGFTQEEGMKLEKAMADGVISVETQRFRVDPLQSYVPRETRAQDPAFWMPKPAK
jgi:hypothetical protein